MEKIPPIKEETKQDQAPIDEEYQAPIITIMGNREGNIEIKSNIGNKIMLKHFLEISLEIVMNDIQKQSNLIYLPGPNGMPVRRS